MTMVDCDFSLKVLYCIESFLRIIEIMCLIVIKHLLDINKGEGRVRLRLSSKCFQH